MLRLVQIFNNIPFSLPGDPNAVFQAGQVAQLGVFGNSIVCGVSDGTCPIGILDDQRTTAFTAPSIDEVIIASTVGVDDGNGNLVAAIDVKQELANPNVVASSFTTSPVDVQLIARNGIIVFPAGTELNYDQDGDGLPDSIRTVVSYTYQIPNIPGDDSTLGSGKFTVWMTRGIFQTDMYETNVRYPVNASLFVNESGMFTTRQPSSDHPGVAIVTGPPTAMHGMLELLFL